MTPSVQQYNLEKSMWTEADFKVMGWHDAAIHAISFQWNNGEWTGDFLLDIDYIFKWVDPVKGKGHFSYWIAPCTLIFKKAFKLDVNIKTDLFGIDAQQIVEVVLADTTQNQEGTITYQWAIELTAGHIKLTSEGFTQIVRQLPIHTDFLLLTQEQRGGVSFSEQPCKLDD
ncbi:hypothetical protein OCK74_27250 [Chitinophagaceae bacterium LB-8]|uniref:Uncharacterized protein n=1 Tax=Paraflavisolibacter caeni TaxID=2982496 RepID=A0A9X3BAI6_9BACT|nr:hypothetical protein [Paraflavisolibacter caeni]MCU7552846.1 hypothetical protein [Paraflavisolibacter caeni]